MRFPCRVLILVLALLSPLAALAQYTIDKVIFQHAAPYTEAELRTTSGLQPGQSLSNDSLTNAAHHLLDTGLFDDAQITLSGQGKARTIIVDLKPIPLDKLLPASFENFVWFTPNELTEGIHKRVPLYRGVASDAGTLPDTIQAALQQMLTEKGITATLSHAIVEPTTDHPRLIVDFTVQSPAVSFGTTTLADIPPAIQQQTLKAIESMKDKPYNEGLSGSTLEDIALAPARAEGYINAHLEDVQRSPTAIPSGIAVNCTAKLVTGDLYHLSTISWQPTTVYSASDFARNNKLHPGDIASLDALTKTENTIANAYLAQGYMDVYILAQPLIDTSAHTVSYTLQAVPGQPFHLHTVTAAGLSPAAQKVFNADWQMKAGDPYSDIAVNAFLLKHVAQPVFRPYTASFRAEGDPQTHLVDLTLTFTPNGTQVY